MDEVFGLPARPLAVGLTIALVAALGSVTVLAARNVVFLKMGLRNVVRRRARSALIVVGLMLGTAIIASALLTGDTMATAVRSSVVETLGATDESITAGTDAEVGGDTALESAKPYFTAAPAVDAVRTAAVGLPVDGVLSAVIEPVAVQHVAGGRTEPRATLFAPGPDDAAAFGFAPVGELGPGEALLDDRAADELAAGPGSEITVLVGQQVVSLRVVGTGAYPGTGRDAPAVLVPLAAAEELLGHPGEVNHLLVSNTGGAADGAGLTETVEPALDQAVAPLGLQAQPVKQDGLEVADATGNTFVQLFTTFGSFSIAAGILLIFLIFVMLATERRPEMGMARAVGTQRRHLVQTFLYEGAAYDLGAAAVGAVLGIAVSFVMVQVVAASFTAEGLELAYDLSLSSLVTAYAIGVLLTLAVVTVSAWRVSRLNIVSAIRDLPEPEVPGRRRGRWVLVGLGVVLGAAMAVSGATSQVYMPWMLGVSIVVIAAAPVLQLLGLSPRVAYSASAIVLLVLWLLPLSTFDGLFGEMAMDFTIWVVGGLVVVVAATWLITYNADLLARAVSWLAAPVASLRPVAKMAVAYPLKSRFRTGVTLAMFMLVVFTLVSGSTIPAAFTSAFDDVGRFGGGFDVRVTTAPATAVPDVRSELPADVAADITADGTQSFLPLELQQAGTGASPAVYPLRGVNGQFTEQTTYELAALASGYGSAEAVWSAVASTPGLAVVDGFVAPRHSHWGAGVLPDFQLSGFYVEDGTFEPVPVVARDPLTGATLDLTVIGVLSDNAPLSMAGVTVDDRTLAPFGERAAPTVHNLVVADGADPEAVATAVEADLLGRGAEAETYAALLDEAVGSSVLFIRLVQGFIALGLVVGVAALGVISARAVVERRQQLGVLRAIGFQPEMIRRSLLVETAMIAVTAIVAGAALGLLISYNVIADTRSQLGYENLSFAVPWFNLALIFAAVIAASLATTVVSALRATRIYPAEALRYQ